MTSICVDPDSATGDQPPIYCNKETYTTSTESKDEYDNLCAAHKNALDALWSDLDGQATFDNASPLYQLPLASCKPISDDLVIEASNNGLDVLQLQENWAAQSIGLGNDVKCNETAYGIFDPVTGERKTIVNEDNQTVNQSVESLYNSYFKDCDPSSAVAPYFLNNAMGVCPTAQFSSQCQDPDKVSYAACRNPGWDYMDVPDTDRWTYDMNSCTNDAFTGSEYNNGSSDSTKTIPDCTKQCCIYSSLVSKDVSGLNCSTCNTTGQWAQNWGGDGSSVPSLKLTGPNGSSLSVPYCNQTGGDARNNRQGIAISLKDAESNDNMSRFGDPTACQSGSDFGNQCNGITGCDGLSGYDATEIRLEPCRLGFSSNAPSNPGTNCPNIYTIQNTANSCRYTLEGGVICTPGDSLLDSSATCENPDDTDLNTMIITETGNSVSGYPRVSNIEIPEGAWLTVYDNGEHPAGLAAPRRSMISLCDPVTFPSDGNRAWTFGCGRDSTGNLVGRAQAIRVKPDGSWVSSTGDAAYLDNVGFCSSGDSNNCDSNVVVDSDAHTCAFDTNEESPFYGWSAGFMPGYYNTTCQTNDVTVTGNECGTAIP